MHTLLTRSWRGSSCLKFALCGQEATEESPLYGFISGIGNMCMLSFVAAKDSSSKRSAGRAECTHPSIDKWDSSLPGCVPHKGGMERQEVLLQIRSRLLL